MTMLRAARPLDGRPTADRSALVDARAEVAAEVFAGRSMTCSQIGRALGLSRQAVQQLCDRALRKLRARHGDDLQELLAALARIHARQSIGESAIGYGRGDDEDADGPELVAVTFRVAHVTRSARSTCPNHPSPQNAPRGQVLVGARRYCEPCAAFLGAA